MNYIEFFSTAEFKYILYCLETIEKYKSESNRNWNTEYLLNKEFSDLIDKFNNKINDILANNYELKEIRKKLDEVGFIADSIVFIINKKESYVDNISDQFGITSR